MHYDYWFVYSFSEIMHLHMHCFSTYCVLVLQVIVFLWSFSTEICANIGQGNVVWLTGKVRESHGILFWKTCRNPANPNAIVAILKGMRTVKLCFSRILRLMQAVLCRLTVIVHFSIKTVFCLHLSAFGLSMHWAELMTPGMLDVLSGLWVLWHQLFGLHHFRSSVI